MTRRGLCGLGGALVWALVTGGAVEGAYWTLASFGAVATVACGCLALASREVL